jgi:hypothetical protein
VDLLFVADVRNGLFGGPFRGLDLPATDLQRCRDHGVPPYNAVRRALGLPPAASFESLTAGLPPRAGAKVAGRLSELYGGDVEAVELLVGALLEPHVPGGAVGPTFAAIIEEQMLRSRAGDPFWFESAGSPWAALWQHEAVAGVEALAATTLARLIRDNSGVDLVAAAASAGRGPYAAAAADNALAGMLPHGSVLYAPTAAAGAGAAERHSAG